MLLETLLIVTANVSLIVAVLLFPGGDIVILIKWLKIAVGNLRFEIKMFIYYSMKPHILQMMALWAL